ncbi:MAG TPA: MmcQ/YjbR family DNA-binding protein [Puia sp.]|nr:MmcQ/YjbR family DNA-binding protein [Puia sp.]
MDIEQLREYCLLKKEATEGFPFGDDTLVFKVKGKIFLIASLNRAQLQFNVKCEPEKAIELREQYDSIQPGYHMNKKLWNTIIMDGSIPQKLIKEMIDDSYLLIIKSLPKKEQTGLI